jgi:hypothetical protein
MNDNKVEKLYHGDRFVDTLYDAITRTIEEYAEGKITFVSVIGTLEKIQYDLLQKMRD